MAVQANRMKIYIDPGYHPIDPPKDDNDEPYLDMDQLPKDIFREEEHHFDYGDGPTDDENLQRVKGGPTPIIDNETVFDAENSLLQESGRYLVKWVGYSLADILWESEQNIFDQHLINAFEFPQKPSHDQKSGMALFKPVFHLTLITYFLWVLLFVSNVLICSSMPNLGPIYNCSQVNDIGVFRFSTGRDCNHNIHNKDHDLHYFQATISEPHIHTTPLVIY